MHLKILSIMCFLSRMAFCQISDKVQIYKIASSKDTSIQCLKGSTLYIKKNSFIDDEGNQPVNDSLQVGVIEVTNKADMVIQKVHTTNERGFLSTGGMIYFEVFDNNKPLKIKDSVQVDVTMETKLNPGIPKLYDLDSSGNWIETNSDIEFMPCKNAFYEFIYDYKQVSKKEYWDYLNAESEKGLSDWTYLSKWRQRKILNNLPVYLIPDQVLDTIYHCPDSEINVYNFKIGKPGWYNLDAEKKLKMNQHIIVKSDVDGLTCHIVIRKDNSSVIGLPTDGGYYFPNLPKGFACYLVAYKILPDGKIQYVIRSMSTDTGTVNLSNFKIADAETFEKSLEIVNQ